MVALSAKVGCKQGFFDLASSDVVVVEATPFNCSVERVSKTENCKIDKISNNETRHLARINKQQTRNHQYPKANPQILADHERQVRFRNNMHVQHEIMNHVFKELTLASQSIRRTEPAHYCTLLRVGYVVKKLGCKRYDSFRFHYWSSFDFSQAQPRLDMYERTRSNKNWN